MADDAERHFLPWVRQGAAAGIKKAGFARLRPTRRSLAARRRAICQLHCAGQGRAVFTVPRM